MKNFYLLMFFILGFTVYSQSQKSIAESHYKSAVTYFETNDLDKAILSINKSIAIDPNNSNDYYIKGVIYQKKQNFKIALSCYKKAIELNAKNTDAMLKCGIVYGKLSDMTNCCKYFNMACNNGSSDGCIGYNKFCK